MAKLSQKQLRELQSIKDALDRAVKYLKKEDTILCTASMPHGLSYYDKHGKGITPVEKMIGSDLCYLFNAHGALTRMILNEQGITVLQI